MAVTGAFPYDIENLLGGAVRFLYAPDTEDIPTKINDVIDMVAPYAPNGDWVDIGATKESFTYTRGFDTEGWEIQQVAGNVIEEITEITRSIEVSVAEFTTDILKILEGDTGDIDAVAAAANVGAQSVLRFGSFSSLTQYRIAFISRRAKASGIVTEPGGATRGRFFMGAGYRAQLSADEIEMEQEKGNLTGTGVGFTLFPEDGEDAGEEYGIWADEAAGTIAGV